MATDWPMHRRNTMRCGATPANVPAKLKSVWKAQLSVQGTQPVVVGDRLWVAEKDAHLVRCLDAASGKDVWDFIAGGRIDSAPTIHGGLVFFGCRDGSVYCLRADDGALVWKFRAAREDRRLVSGCMANAGRDSISRSIRRRPGSLWCSTTPPPTR